jgi:alpha-methylacyl-CoA racemase
VSGPLAGIRVVEMASAAPGPFAAMMLADLGAEVLRVDRADAVGRPPARPIDPLARSRRSVAIDTKNPAGPQAVLRLAARADVLIEGFRPGVMERLGLGPRECLARNPGLVYGRMTGWGQQGTLRHRAGHDINYLGLSGALHSLGRAGERPHAPLNLVADFGGGGMLLVVGVLAALVERAHSGVGQVVDAAMVDGSTTLTAFVRALQASGDWSGERGTNLLDGGAPFYDTYETADGGYMSVGALERRFYALFLAGLGLSADDLPAQLDRAGWPELRRVFAAAFKTRTRDEWTAIFRDVDACVYPVLSLAEVADYPLVRERRGFVTVDGMSQPAPAPRFDRTPPGDPTAAPRPGQHSRSALLDWGFSTAEIGRLETEGAVASAGSAAPNVV